MELFANAKINLTLDILRKREDGYHDLQMVMQSVTLADEFAPFLRPNQYVDYAPAVNTVKKAAELTKGVTDPLEQDKAI